MISKAEIIRLIRAYSLGASGRGVGVPGGTTTQVQYNKAGAFGGASMTWDETNKTLTIPSSGIGIQGVSNGDPTDAGIWIQGGDAAADSDGGGGALKFHAGGGGSFINCQPSKAVNAAEP